MTERKPAGMPYESWIDKQIREAQERGAFEDLPGKGKPLPGHGKRYDENWWLHGYLERENVPVETMLPEPLKLRREIHHLPETVHPLTTEEQVRDVVSELNQRIVTYLRVGGGPRVPVAPVDAGEVVARWRDGRSSGV
jgi:DnaJ-like protein